MLDFPAQADGDWDSVSPVGSSSAAPWKIYNIGNSRPIELLKFIECLEDALGLKAVKEFLPLQDGDVPNTFADVEGLSEKFSYRPIVPIEEGVSKFAKWYLEYYS